MRIVRTLRKRVNHKRRMKSICLWSTSAKWFIW